MRADRISAFVDDENMLHVNVNGDESVYHSEDIDGIYVLAKDGNDRVRIDPSVLQWTHIRGGAGNDGIQGGSGNDRIDGGERQRPHSWRFGDDLLIGGAGRDSISGGFGNDGILGGAAQRSPLGR